MLKIIGITVLSLLTTAVILVIFYYLSSHFLDWLDTHYGAQTRRLLKVSLQSTTNDGGQAREETNHRIYSAYPIQSAYQFPKTRKRSNVIRVKKLLCVIVENQKKKCNTKYHTTNIKGFSHFHSLMLNPFRSRCQPKWKRTD